LKGLSVFCFHEFLRDYPLFMLLLS